MSGNGCFLGFCKYLQSMAQVNINIKHIIGRMGIIKSKDVDDLPKQYSYDHTKTLISELNALCKQNAKSFGFTLHLRTSQLQYNHSDWRRSIVPGTVHIKKPSKSKTFNIFINLKAIYKSHQTMKHFKKKLSESVMSTPCDGASTPNEQCCICMDKTATMMLPCYHTFCSNCIQTYIIDKQQKRCPVCRAEFEEDSMSLKSKIITVVGDEEYLINDLRQILLGHLRELSSHQVVEIEKELKFEQNDELMPEIMQDH